MNYNQKEDYWQPNQNDNTYYNQEQDYSNLLSQEMEFQSFNNEDRTNNTYQENRNFIEAPFIPSHTQQYPTDMFTPLVSDEDSEPPLLEELEIYPDRILEKTLAVLNPFRSHSLADDAEFLLKETDLAGPITFCLMLACCLFLSGNKAPFGYIYGLSVISCLLMYALLTLMTSSSEAFTLACVASILGYCILPIVALSVLGIFVSLHGMTGITLALLAVFWSSLSASRLFVALSGDASQRPLIAYPCALVCGVFALLVVF